MRRTVAVVGLLVAPILVGAQTAKPRFEVASIKKLDQPVTFRGFPTPPIRGGTVNLQNSTVASLIQFAYGLRDFQIVGGPDWMKKDLFEVTAKAAGEPSRSDVLVMLRSLLEDRFGLRMHPEQREIRFLAMVLARDDGRPGPSLRARVAGADCSLGSADALEEMKRKEAAGHAMASHGCGPLSRLAELVSRFTEMPVFDRTGLSGDWGGTLYFGPDRNVGPFAGRLTADPDPNLPSFTAALREQFGIRLEQTRGPVEVHVIDSVHQPTEN